MLGSILQRARDIASKGAAQLTKVDDLERICLAAGGAMFADGKCEDAEFDAAMKVIEGRFNGVFSRTQIEAALQKAVRTFEGGKFSGRRAVFAAMANVENKDEGEAIFAVVLDVADSSGGIGEDEMPYITELAKKLRVDPAAYGI